MKREQGETDGSQQFGFIAALAWLLLLSACGGTSLPGVYVYNTEHRGYNRHGEIVVFSQTATYDLRSDGSFVWTFDPGKDAEGISGGNREVTNGKWSAGDDKIVCYNGDGTTFGELRKEGNDLLSKEANRYRRQ